MDTTSQGRQRVRSKAFARLVSALHFGAPDADAQQRVRRNIAVALCSRGRVHGFPESEIDAFLNRNSKMVETALKACLRITSDSKKQNPVSLAHSSGICAAIAAQGEWLEQLKNEGYHFILVAADTKIANEMNTQAAVSASVRMGTKVPAVSWTPQQSHVSVHAKRSLSAIQ